MQWLGYTVLGIVLGAVVLVLVVVRRPALPVKLALILSLIAAMTFFAWTTRDAFGFVWVTFMLGWLLIRLRSRRPARTEPPGIVPSDDPAGESV